MLKEKMLKPHMVNDIHEVGAYIKILSCENKFRLIVMRKGQKILDSNVYAGFELTPTQGFDLVQLISETEQDVSIWVSAVKMSYDALSAQPSHAQSYIVEHYGESQKISPFDPKQASITMVMDDRPCWVGGEGVMSDSGMYVAAGERYKHNSAAPLHVFITDPISRVAITSNAPITKPVNVNIFKPQAMSVISGRLYINEVWNRIWAVDLATGIPTYQQSSPLSSGKFGTRVVAGWNDDHYVLFDTNLGEIKLGRIANATGYVEQMKIALANPAQSTRALTFSGDHFICAGANYQNEAGDYVVDFYLINRDGSHTIYSHSSSWIGDVFDLQTDPITGQIWITTSAGVYTANPDLTNIQRFTTDFKNSMYQIMFDTDFVVLTNELACRIYNRDGTEVATQLAKYAAYISGNQFVVQSSGGVIYESVNAGASFSEVYNPEEPLLNSHRIAYEHAGRVHFMAAADDGSNQMRLVSYEAGLDVSRPKTRIRVLKESY